jgi:hypothetical protein
MCQKDSLENIGEAVEGGVLNGVAQFLDQFVELIEESLEHPEQYGTVRRKTLQPLACQDQARIGRAVEGEVSNGVARFVDQFLEFVQESL